MLKMECLFLCQLNLFDGISSLNTRLRELAVQKTSGLLQPAEISAITSEENAIIIAADKIADTELNNVDLLSEVSIAVSQSGTLAYVGQQRNQS